MKSFQIGHWSDADQRSVQVTPAFYLHDVTNGASAGPAWAAWRMRSKPSGTISYLRQGDNDVLLIPVKAYGDATLVRGRDC